MQVMDCDRYSQNDAMGEVRINIDEMDLTKSVEVYKLWHSFQIEHFEYIELTIFFSQQIWAELIRKRKPPVERPELLLSLNYLPQAERLTVVIMKAKNLETEQDPYVKVKFDFIYSKVIKCNDF